MRSNIVHSIIDHWMVRLRISRDATTSCATPKCGLRCYLRILGAPGAASTDGLDRQCHLRWALSVSLPLATIILARIPRHPPAAWTVEDRILTVFTAPVTVIIRNLRKTVERRKEVGNDNSERESSKRKKLFLKGAISTNLLLYTMTPLLVKKIWKYLQKVFVCEWRCNIYFTSLICMYDIIELAIYVS